MADTALAIESGAELERFIPGTVVIGRRKYLVLTGFESPDGHRCFWCGAELHGKLYSSLGRPKHYCYGHMTAYWNHFEWGYASDWCRERYNWTCANCGLSTLPYHDSSKFGVHHIVPFNGAPREQFSPFHLPWNLVLFCKDCHLEIHAAMRPEKLPPDPWDRALKVGQILMPLNIRR